MTEHTLEQTRWSLVSRSPAEIPAEAGIEMTSAAFWQDGFDVIAGMIDELETLA